MKSSTSSSGKLTRRGFFVSLAALGLAGCQTAGRPVANPNFRIARFVVDAQPLRDLGGGYNADFLQQAVTQEAAKKFAPFMGGPAGNEVILQIGALQMQAQPAELYGFGIDSWSNDYLDGVVIVKQGGVVNRYKFLTVTPSSAGGAWYLPDNVWRRERVLAQQYVEWVRREVFGSF